MGSNHALSGAVLSLSLSAAAPLVGLHPTPLTVALCAVITAGAAVWPDIDHPNSTAARSVGPITRLLSWVISRVSDKVRDWTCRCCRTDGNDGHRTLTHTGVFAITTGVGVTLAGNRWGVAATAITVGIAVGLAGLGLGALVDVKDRDLTGIALGVGAGLAVWQFGGGMEWWWLGIPIAVGTFVHAVGDGYYTPEPLAAWLCRFVAEVGLDKIGPEPEQVMRITAIDPSCGSGIFLVHSARVLSHAYAARLVGGEPSGDLMLAVMPRIVLECVFGVDIDPVAVDLARLAVSLETCGAITPAMLDRHIICGNVLDGDSPPAMEDKVSARAAPAPTG